MYCPKCGAQNDDNAFRCISCQEIIQPIPSQTQSVPTDDSQAMRMIIPIDRSGLAVAAGYLGLVSILYVFAPFALVLGILAIRDIKKHPEKHGMGRAIFAVVMGGIFTVVLLISIVVSLIAIFVPGR